MTIYDKLSNVKRNIAKALMVMIILVYGSYDLNLPSIVNFVIVVLTVGLSLKYYLKNYRCPKCNSVLNDKLKDKCHICGQDFNVDINSLD